MPPARDAEYATRLDHPWAGAPTSQLLPRRITETTAVREPAAGSGALGRWYKGGRQARRLRSGLGNRLSAARRRPASDKTVKRDQRLEQRRQPVQQQCVRAVGESARRILMDFEEDRIDAHRHARPGQRLNIRRLTAARPLARPGQLQTVGHVEHDRIAPSRSSSRGPGNRRLDFDNRTTSPRFGQQNVVVSGACDLFGRVPHIHGREELALLDVDSASALAGFDQ